MPIYEYVCSACGHRADIVHGIHDAGPNFCPECGTEGSMKKAFAAPAILFKGSGWAKKDRSSTSTPASKSSGGDASTGDSSGGGSTTAKSGDSASTTSSSSSGSSGGSSAASD